MPQKSQTFLCHKKPGLFIKTLKKPDFFHALKKPALLNDPKKAFCVEVFKHLTDLAYNTEDFGTRNGLENVYFEANGFLIITLHKLFRLRNVDLNPHIAIIHRFKCQ